ncbi:MAG TPA: AprI/Inh family metalloprotease inhibitor [Xanthobacteraceae bacterium]|jgi:hypothetical protein|nr:AprI/Inh family metalloprotease inhibitor [Xanthobacteraceae bacterium]
MQARLVVLIALSFLIAACGSALAQSSAALSDMTKAMLGNWEFSNADRDKTCIISFKLDNAPGGRMLELDKNCGTTFALMREVSGWTVGKNDSLHLIDGKGKVVLEFTEVENGLFESSHAGDSLYFLQTQAAAEGRDHTPDQMFGDWAFARASTPGKPICQISLLDTAADTESFALRVKSGCDALIGNFGPRSWRMDRGQFVLLPVKGDAWRFEESDNVTWRRIPEGRQPLLLIRQGQNAR